MLKLLNDFGEVSAQGGYSNPVHFDLDARFDDEFVQQLTLSCAEGYVAKNVTLTDTGDTADRYFFSVNGTSWADSAEFATITDNATCYIKARTTENETAATLHDTKLVLTYEIEPAATPTFYYTNPGDADLLAVEDATTVNATAAQSVTGKAFYGGQLADMFHTPDLQEVWIRLDLWFTNNRAAFYIGHFGSGGSKVVGIQFVYYDDHLGLWDGSTRRAALDVIGSARNTIVLHIKSGELIEMTANGSTVSWTGNVNGGAPLNNLVALAYDDDNFFSNVVVSSDEIDSNCGWHRDLFSLETVVTAPVLNVRFSGQVHQYLLTTKKTTPAVAVRVGDRNFYAPLVRATDSLASAVRLNLNDTTYALKT